MAKYRIFISHKEEDEATAIAVRDALQQFSGDLEFFISGQNIPEGDDWKKVLRKKLKESDLLLLLFTEPTRNWDWPLYEVGLFTKLDEEDEEGVEPVVCMYNSDAKQPSPLGSTQGVEATLPDVTRFVERLIRTTKITGHARERPLNESVTEDQIAAAARAICDHFGGNIDTYYATYRLHLEIPPLVGECKGIPAESTIDATDRTMRLFGRLRGTSTWGELVQSHRDAGARWLNEIDRVFCNARAKQVSVPTTQTFRAHDGAQILRPELYRLDRKGDTPIAAVVIFTEEVAPAKVGGAVFNLIRIAERYKTEVFRRLESAGDPLNDANVAELTESFDLIREEAKTHNVFDGETLKTSFSDEASRAELLGIAVQWDQHADEFRRAQEAGDNGRIRPALEALDELNDQYRAIVARRYAELLN